MIFSGTKEGLQRMITSGTVSMACKALDATYSQNFQSLQARSQGSGGYGGYMEEANKEPKCIAGKHALGEAWPPGSLPLTTV